VAVKEAISLTTSRMRYAPGARDGLSGKWGTGRSFTRVNGSCKGHVCVVAVPVSSSSFLFFFASFEYFTLCGASVKTLSLCHSNTGSAVMLLCWVYQVMGIDDTRLGRPS